VLRSGREHVSKGGRVALILEILIVIDSDKKVCFAVDVMNPEPPVLSVVAEIPKISSRKLRMLFLNEILGGDGSSRVKIMKREVPANRNHNDIIQYILCFR
jgi:hypothetical protein